MYAEGARLTDLKEVRDLVYAMQRPAIAPEVQLNHFPGSIDLYADLLCTFHSSSTHTNGARRILPSFTIGVSSSQSRHSASAFRMLTELGIPSTITGAFKKNEQRAFWQCNLASTDRPTGPSAEDVAKWV